MKKLLILAALLLGPLFAQGQTQYFVNAGASGNDGNSGTSAGTPWKTISHAIATANLTGGATINVAAGTYGEAIACAGRTAAVCINRSGPSSTQRLTLKCSTQWSVPSGSGCLIRNNSANGGISINANNVELNGFDFTSPGQVVGIVNTCPGGPASGACPSGNNVRIINNYVHDVGQTANDGAGGGTGCPSWGMVFSGSITHGTAYQTNVEIIGNRLSNYGNQALARRNGGSCNLAHGIYADTANSTIENNVVIQAVAYGIQFYSEPCNGIISNNTVDQAGTGNVVIAGGGCTAAPNSPNGKITINNNIFESAPFGAVQLGANGAAGTSPCTSTNRVKISNNLLAAGEAITTGGSLNGCTDITGTTFEAPTATFGGYSATSTNNNYQILTPSSGVGTGTTSCVSGQSVCVPTLDFVGRVRPNPPSRGAYELASSTGTPSATFTPTSFDFGSSPVGTPTTIQQFTYTSTGTANVVIGTETLSNTTDFSFGGTGSCSNGQSLAPGNACTVSAKCTPSTTGPLSGNLIVTDNSSGSPHTVPLTCTGTNPGAPAISLSQPSATLGNTSVNTNSTGPTVTITNSGTANLIISSTGGVDAANWSVNTDSSCLSGPIPPAGTCFFIPTFSPTSPGAKSTTYTITANTTPTTTTFALSGTAVQSNLSVSPASLTFSDTPVGSNSAVKTFTLTNNSTNGPAVLTFNVTGNYSQTNNCGSTLAPSGACTVSVTFSPLSSGSLPGTVAITVPDGGPNPTGPLTGNGIIPTNGVLIIGGVKVVVGVQILK